MLSSELYHHIIEKEKKGISDASLRKAARTVSATYSPKALKTGSTYLDYSKPQNRCAYLYKYSAIHTALVTKFFRKLVKKKIVRKNLFQKKDIQICCLGGGPGTDVVGIFKALALYPHMHQRISQATILDLSIGWHHSFNHVVQNLINGNVKDIPETFVRKDFKSSFLEVNLLEPLPKHVMEAISNADVICMVKFVSAVLGNKDSLKALKILAELLKIGAVVLFIDNFESKLSESIQEISELAGLKIILGPEVNALQIKIKSEEALFGCLPLRGARTTAIGMIKTDEARLNTNLSTTITQDLIHNGENDADWNTESEDSCSDSLQFTGSMKKPLSDNTAKAYCNKYTQTEDSMEVNSGIIMELIPLINAFSKLLSVVTKFKTEQQCFYCSNHRMNHISSCKIVNV